MKLLATSALTLCLLIAVGCAEGNAPDPSAESVIANATNKVEANIEGMDCSGCSSAVVAAVKGVDGVEAASADVASGDVKVALKEDVDATEKLLEIESVLQELQEGKYTVKSITASHPADSEGTPTEEPATEEPAEEEPAEEEQASVETAEYFIASYAVKGMDCSGCSTEVAFAVEDIEGVSKAKADHKTGQVMVSYEEGVAAETKEQEVKDVITGLSDGKYSVTQ
jgi:copper chaperone CopZ